MMIPGIFSVSYTQRCKLDKVNDFNLRPQPIALHAPCSSASSRCLKDMLKITCGYCEIRNLEINIT